MSDEDELLAAELAFGLIEGEERRAAEHRSAGDAAFAEAVARWQAYGATMLGGRAEPPRPSLWARIEGRLPANDVGTSPRGAGRRWRIATFAACAAALAFATIAVERQPSPALRRAMPAGAPLVAMLTGTDSKAVVAVSFDPAQRRLTISPAALRTGGHSAELWVIPADKRPRSLGLIATGGNWRDAPPEVAGIIAPGATLAVSIEPVGGSPSGQPTGPVILSGTIHAI